jgi:hypothetical protein
MEKQEYFKSRLMYDYRQYLLSNKPNAAKRLIQEATTLIESLMYDGSKSIFARCQKRIDVHLEANYGPYSDLVGLQKLPKNFKWTDVCNAINAEFDAEMKRVFSKLDIEKNLTMLISPRVEAWVWTEGIAPTAKMLASMPGIIGKMVQSYRPEHLDDYPLKKEIGEMFVDAKHITLREWVKKSNDRDILKLKNGMKEYSRCQLNATLYRHMERLGKSLKEMPLWKLSTHLGNAIDTLKVNPLPQVRCDEHPEWSVEYGHRVPVDFYFRNVESVSAAGAFHLLVLQAIARNENQLVEHGYIRPLGIAGKEPEITIFSNSNVCFPEVFKVMDETIKTLVD